MASESKSVSVSEQDLFNSGCARCVEYDEFSGAGCGTEKGSTFNDDTGIGTGPRSGMPFERKPKPGYCRKDELSLIVEQRTKDYMKVFCSNYEAIKELNDESDDISIESTQLRLNSIYDD